MAGNVRDISFGSFNLYNLQLPGERWRGSTPYTQAEYDEKIAWAREMVRAMDADVIAFQELWSPQCLRDIFADPAIAGDYDLAFIRDTGWYDIAVAAAVRRPWAIRRKTVHKTFPSGFRLIKREVDQTASVVDEDDDIEVVINAFSRSLLQLTLAQNDHAEVPEIECFAVHLKSKLPTRLDSQERNSSAIRPHATALGNALSTIRRTAESAALRIILNGAMRDTDTPVVVVGDCNDAANSNTLAIMTEQPSFRFYADSRAGRTSDRGLYLAGAQQQLRSFRDVNYTHIYKGEYDSLDHVLASEQFYDHSAKRVWSFREMRIWNDHLPDEGEGGVSDHGLVCARYDYNPA